MLQKYLRVVGMVPAKLHFCPFLLQAYAELHTSASVPPRLPVREAVWPVLTLEPHLSRVWWRAQTQPWAQLTRPGLGLAGAGTWKPVDADLPARSPCTLSA